MMVMKSVELSEEDSKEFVELLKRDDPAAIEAFLNGKAVGEVATSIIPALTIIEQLQKLQEDEVSILAKCFHVRQTLMAALTEVLLSSPQDVKEDAPFSPPEETAVPETDVSDAPDVPETEIRDERTRPGARAYEGPKAEKDSDPVEETSPTSTDQKTPS